MPISFTEKWCPLAYDNSHNEWQFLTFSLSVREISKDDRALIKILLLEKNWSSQRLLRKCSGNIGRGQVWNSSCWRASERHVVVHDKFVHRNFRRHWTCRGAYCDWLDGATLVSKVVSNKLRLNAKNEIPSISAKFRANLINISTAAVFGLLTSSEWRI